MATFYGINTFTMAHCKLSESGTKEMEGGGPSTLKFRSKAVPTPTPTPSLKSNSRANWSAELLPHTNIHPFQGRRLLLPCSWHGDSAAPKFRKTGGQNQPSGFLFSPKIPHPVSRGAAHKTHFTSLVTVLSLSGFHLTIKSVHFVGCRISHSLWL